MNNLSRMQEPEVDAPARNYFFLALAALAVIFILLLRRGLGVWSLLPVVLGLFSITLPWRVASFATLIGMALVLFRFDPGFRIISGSPAPADFFVPDFIFCVATLAYCVSIFRLQSLTGPIFLADSRKRPRDSKGPAALENRRDPRLISPGEVGWLVLSLPAWPLLAQVARRYLTLMSEAPGDLDPKIWQGIVLTWLLTLAIWLIGSLLGYANWRRLDKLEANLFLIDKLWYETRREQRRLQRWLVWWRRHNSGKA